ncbi:MAG: hypothetical protein ACXWDA_07425, partial [Aeromicrobium sp.]
LWVALAALALGAIVAVFGVRADVEANQRHEQVRKDDQQIRKYADARSTAVYFVKNGATISVVMKGLQRFDDEDLGLMNDMR